MVHYTLNEENLIQVENPYALIKEIFDITDCDIQTTIDNFNTLYRWDKMFDEDEVVKRLEDGHRFFIFYQEDLVVGHCWFDPNNIYVYNVFVDKRYHDKTISDSTVYLTIVADKIFSEGYKTIHIDVDEWHKKSQSFFERMGFKKIN